MSLQTLPAQFSKGGSNLTDGTLQSVLKELQGLTVSIVSGVASGTKMDIAAMRTEDTLLAALVTTDASNAAVVNDVANLTIQATKASGTLTVSGNPVDGETFVVNGATYTFKTTPVGGLQQVKIVTGDNNAMAANIAAAINAYENRRLAGISNTGPNLAAVVATAATNVCTVTSVVDGLGNGVVLTGTATVLAATGTGTASATLTPVTVVADNTCVISGVTFTAKVAPAPLPGAAGAPTVQFYTKAAAPAYPGVAGATAGSDCATGHWLARAINDYEKANLSLDVVATAHATTGVVTLVPRKPFAGNIITLTEAATNVAASGSGTLAGGTNTGGIKSGTNLTGKTLTVMWFNKQ